MTRYQSRSAHSFITTTAPGPGGLGRTVPTLYRGPDLPIQSCSPTSLPDATWLLFPGQGLCSFTGGPRPPIRQMNAPIREMGKLRPHVAEPRASTRCGHCGTSAHPSPTPFPLTPPPIHHLGNSAGDTKDQDTAQALFHQGFQHLFQAVHTVPVCQG